jgi:hypothetical protein
MSVAKFWLIIVNVRTAEYKDAKKKVLSLQSKFTLTQDLNWNLSTISNEDKKYYGHFYYSITQEEVM